MVPGNVIGMASHSGWKLIRQGRRTPIVIPLQEALQRITSREIEYTTYHPIEPPKNASSWSVVPESPLIPSPAGPPVPDGVVWVLGSLGSPGAAGSAVVLGAAAELALVRVGGFTGSAVGMMMSAAGTSAALLWMSFGMSSSRWVVAVFLESQP